MFNCSFKGVIRLRENKNRQVKETSQLTAASVSRSTQIKTYSWDNAQVLLVGNKCDMDDERVVSGDRGRQLADHLGESVAELGGVSGAGRVDVVLTRTNPSRF